MHLKAVAVSCVYHPNYFVFLCLRLVVAGAHSLPSAAHALLVHVVGFHLYHTCTGIGIGPNIYQQW